MKILYYICETSKYDKILGVTDCIFHAKKMIKTLIDNHPNEKFFITLRLLRSNEVY